MIPVAAAAWPGPPGNAECVRVKTKGSPNFSFAEGAKIPPRDLVAEGRSASVKNNVCVARSGDVLDCMFMWRRETTVAS